MEIYERILDIKLPKRQSAFLWGARKTGKTFYLRQHFADSLWINLLDTDLFLLYSKTPSQFREHILAAPAAKLDLPIIVDEAQKVPLIFDEVHYLIEEKGLRFILCGSSARKLKRGQANLLGWRAWRYEMHPLTSQELGEVDLLRVLQRGLIPSHYLSEESERSLHSYINDYLKEEIRDEGLTRNLQAFSRFLDAVGYSCGEILVYANIARDCGVDAKTVKEYFQILVDTHIGYYLLPFSKKRGRGIISHAPKFYIFDVGIAGQLAKRRISELRGAEAGHAFENFIFNEIIAYQSYKNREFTVHFWRTKTGLEVDFIIEDHSKLICLEVKIGSRIDRSELKGIAAFQEEHKPDKSIVVCLESRPRVVELLGGSKVTIQPWRSFLEDLWADRLV